MSENLTPKKTVQDCCRVCSLEFVDKYKKRKRTITSQFSKVFESVVNQKVLSEDGLPGAVCDTCKYRIERAWRMSNQDQSDLQQLRSNAADTAQTLRFKRGHPVSPAFTCTSKGDENVTVVRKKKGQRLVFDPSPLEPCQIQPPLSADHYPQVLCLPLSSNSDDCVPQLQ
ncbi:hypothetical protein OS493_004267 [Desmophyllum pertusum]|uniref:ZAD domain-containing protein n=1 Tax=Desmophyllum pertusum TaxID=174260 RepID=A0A9X0CY36_9CNID|nr:hypothetical protein OS493_013076 [Desmophyllum pertusum]KAJ7377684.1 hypothetical protein OS493_027763 [Desmophyllum pertusum]KAJ7387290.1 hypothetical protein OS493_004267 [Desmophyllum pertusum]